MTSGRFCTFGVETMTIGLPVALVEEVTVHPEVTPVPLAPRVVAGLAYLRGRILPVVELRRCLDLPPRAAEARPMHVIVRTPAGSLSLAVDRLLDVIQADEGLFEETPAALAPAARQLIAGMVKLRDRLLLLLDLDAVLALTGIASRARP